MDCIDALIITVPTALGMTCLWGVDLIDKRRDQRTINHLRAQLNQVIRAEEENEE